MYKLRYVDAICKVPTWAGYERKNDNRFLPKLRQENDINANVQKLRIWERRMERRWHLLCLQGTGLGSW